MVSLKCKRPRLRALVVHEIYLPTQDTTWWFDAAAVSQYVITARCDDGKTGGVDTAQSVISLVPNLAPVITNLPRMTREQNI